MLVFYKYLLLYFCFQRIFYFLLEYIKLKKYQNILHLKMFSCYYHSPTKLSNEFLLIHNHQFITYTSSFILGKLFLDKSHYIEVRFDNTFVYKNLLKGEATLIILVCTNCDFTNSICVFSY